MSVPEGLGAAGAALWAAVTGGYELRADELLVLEEACRTADDAARLDGAVRAAELLVPGSMGQPRAHPLLNEARQARALLATLLKHLALPDEEADRAAARNRSQKAVDAARARWSRRGA